MIFCLKKYEILTWSVFLKDHRSEIKSHNVVCIDLRLEWQTGNAEHLD
jgi:hypothetical protein